MSEKTLADRVGAASEPAHPHHPDVATWRAATAADIDAIHAVQASADRVDHPTWTTPREDVAETFELSHIDAVRDTIVAVTAEGEVVAYGLATRHPSIEERVQVSLQGAVSPASRRRGIGRAVFTWQHARAEHHLAELGATAAGAELPAEVHVYLGEENTALAAVGEELGYRTERWFSTMVRDVTEPIPDAVAPAGIELVPFAPERAEDARLARNDAFRDHWGSLPSPSERWQKFVTGPFLRPELCTLAIDDGRVVAFCLASVNPDDAAVLGPHSYIDLVGVVRSHRRRGLAPTVITRTLAAIRDAGLGKAVLDVDTESPTGANTLYGGLGFVATERDRVLVRRY